MKADGSSETQLSPADGDSGGDIDPAWSPDGTRIAFASLRAGSWNLWMMNADGSSPHRIADVFATDPSWSPDGRQLAYVGLNAIGIVDADGGNPHAISGPGGFPSGPSWSPDGSRIVFARNDVHGYPGDLYLAGPDGSGETRLTNDGANKARPSWSPDGSEIVFQRTESAPGGWNLWAIGADGLNPRQITAAGDALGPDWGTSHAVPEPSPPDAPTIDIYSPADGAFYLPGMAADAFYLCSSQVAPVVSCEGDVPVGGPLDVTSAGTHTFTVRAVDAEGRTATRSVTYFVPDFEAPVIELRVPSDGGSYDLGAEATVDYSCSDPDGVGVAECQGDLPNGAPVDTREPGPHRFTVFAVDNAGNLRVLEATYTVVDTRPPLIDIASPSDGADYVLGSEVLAAYSCRSPSHARIVTCDGTVPSGGRLDTASIGSHRFEVTASDENGRSSRRAHTYTVVYDFGGFESPVASNGAIDDAKAGDAIPLKFSLAGDHGLNVVAGTTWRPASCSDWSTTADAAGGQGKLSYSAANDRYLDLVSSSSSWKGSCRILRLELADGTSHAVRVRFKR